MSGCTMMFGSCLYAMCNWNWVGELWWRHSNQKGLLRLHGLNIFCAKTSWIISLVWSPLWTPGLALPVRWAFGGPSSVILSPSPRSLFPGWTPPSSPCHLDLPAPNPGQVSGWGLGSRSGTRRGGIPKYPQLRGVRLRLRPGPRVRPPTTGSETESPGQAESRPGNIL